MAVIIFCGVEFFWMIWYWRYCWESPLLS